MDQAVANHLIFSFESFAAFGPGASRYGAIVRPILRMYVRMRAWFGFSAAYGGLLLRETYFKRY